MTVCVFIIFGLMTFNFQLLFGRLFIISTVHFCKNVWLCFLFTQIVVIVHVNATLRLMEFIFAGISCIIMLYYQSLMFDNSAAMFPLIIIMLMASAYITLSDECIEQVGPDVPLAVTHCNKENTRHSNKTFISCFRCLQINMFDFAQFCYVFQYTPNTS